MTRLYVTNDVSGKTVWLGEPCYQAESRRYVGIDENDSIVAWALDIPESSIPDFPYGSCVRVCLKEEL